jgi:hypothetical protein
VKKGDNRTNFAACVIINRRIHNNSLCREKNKVIDPYKMLFLTTTRPSLHCFSLIFGILIHTCNLKSKSICCIKSYPAHF